MSMTNPAMREALAAEYVLGTLEAKAVAEVEAVRGTDPLLHADIMAWEARLAPLQALATPEAPPADLWSRIDAMLDGKSGSVRTATPPARWLNLWRGWALGASAVAAGLAAFVLLQPSPAPQFSTVLLTQTDQPAWTVQADRGGTLRLAALNPRQADPNRVYQLWALAPGATVPTSLGLIPASGQITVTPGGLRPEAGMLIEISLEPPGGSTTGRPTGPILFIGRLTIAGAS